MLATALVVAFYLGSVTTTGALGAALYRADRVGSTALGLTIGLLVLSMVRFLQLCDGVR